jgi:uncharacterized protein YqgC (DUF456 family)
VDLTDTATAVNIVSGLLILAGLVGIAIPVVPGLVLCWLGVLVWAILGDGGWFNWLALAAVTVIAGVGTVVKYAWPGRSLKRTGVSNLSLFVGAVLAIVGFFVVPVLGLVLGFLLGIWLAELVRLSDAGQAWRATLHAVKAVGLSLLIELAAGILIAVIWVVGLVVAYV